MFLFLFFYYHTVALKANFKLSKVWSLFVYAIIACWSWPTTQKDTISFKTIIEMVQNTLKFICHDQMKCRRTTMLTQTHLNRQTVHVIMYRFGQGERLASHADVNFKSDFFSLNWLESLAQFRAEDSLIKIRDHWLVKDQREKIKEI